VHLVLADEVSDRGVRDEDLERQRPTVAGRPRKQGLAHDALEHERQLRPDLRLLVRREDVDDAVDRLRGGVRVQRPEREVARLRDPQRDSIVSSRAFRR
jgi:hypothetical protein